MIDTQSIQKAILIFEQKNALVTIKTENYDIYMEPLTHHNILLTLRININYDITNIMQKISQEKYAKFQISIYKDMLQISCFLAIKHLTIDKLTDNIRLLEQFI